MTTQELTFSTFLRHPKQVTARLQFGDVVLRRRGARALRLSLEGRNKDRDTDTALVARMLADAATDDAGRKVLLKALRHTLTWIDILPRDAQNEFLGEFLRTAQASAEVGAHAPLGQLLRDWQETAALYADPELTRELTRPLPGNAGRVPLPEIFPSSS